MIQPRRPISRSLHRRSARLAPPEASRGPRVCVLWRQWVAPVAYGSSRIPVLLPVPAFSHAIENVVALRAQEEMVRVNAMPHVAVMAYVQPVGNRAAKLLPRIPGRHNPPTLTADPELPIALICSARRPEPASVCLLNAGPERSGNPLIAMDTPRSLPVDEWTLTFRRLLGCSRHAARPFICASSRCAFAGFFACTARRYRASMMCGGKSHAGTRSIAFTSS